MSTPYADGSDPSCLFELPLDDKWPAVGRRRGKVRRSVRVMCRLSRPRSREPRRPREGTPGTRLGCRRSPSSSLGPSGQVGKPALTPHPVRPRCHRRRAVRGCRATRPAASRARVLKVGVDDGVGVPNPLRHGRHPGPRPAGAHPRRRRRGLGPEPEGHRSVTGQEDQTSDALRATSEGQCRDEDPNSRACVGAR